MRLGLLFALLYASFVGPDVKSQLRNVKICKGDAGFEFRVSGFEFAVSGNVGVRSVKTWVNAG